MRRFFLIVCLALSVSCSRKIADIRDFGVVPDTGTDITASFNAALQQCRANGVRTLRLEPGVYDFWPENATNREIFVSNTSDEEECPSKVKHLGLLIEDIHNLTIEGNGANLIFHGKQTMIAVIHSSGIKFCNLEIDCLRPGNSEMTVERVDSGFVWLRLPQSSWYEITPAGTLEMVGEGWKTEYPVCVEFDPSSEHLSGSPLWNMIRAGKSEEIEPGLVKVATPEYASFKLGNTITVRDRIRDEVGVLNLESNDLVYENIGVHTLHAIGVISQFCRNVTFRNDRFEPKEGSGRILVSSADFLHFSGCAGKVTVSGCRFSGAQDDPINVHGTYLVVEEVISPKQLRVKFHHHQTYGMQAFWPGDTISFVNRNSLRTVAYSCVDTLNRLSEREVLLTLKDTVPSCIKACEYAVENLTWTPEVEITGNYFTRTHTRGTLLSTPRKAVIRDNTYYKIGMSGILISGDAMDWFESGAVKDVTIQDNHFIDCAYNDGAAIYIDPTNEDTSLPVHGTIRIVGNAFEPDGRVLMRLNSVENLIVDPGVKVDETN